MTHRVRASLALVLLVGLAGCAGLLGGDAGTPTPDAGGTETTPSPSSPSSDLPFRPAGVAADGDVNETALLRAHYRALRDAVYRIEYESHRGGSVSVNLTTVNNFTHRLTRDHRPNGEVSFRTGYVFAQHRRPPADSFADEEYDYEHARQRTAPRPFGSADSNVQTDVAVGEFEAAGTVTRNGETLVRLNATAPKPDTGALEYDGYRGTLLVDEAGLIREVRATKTFGDPPEPTTVRVEVSTEPDAVPVPSWYASLPRGSAEMTADDTAVRVRLTDGPTVPAGTEVRFRAGGDDYELTTERSIEPEGTVYLSVRSGDDGPTPVLARSQPDPAAGMDIGDARNNVRFEFGDVQGLDAPVTAAFYTVPPA